MKTMGARFLVIHSGSHGGQGQVRGEELMVESLNRLLPHCPDNMFLLIELMAGQGTELGGSLEQVQRIMDKVEDNKKLGVCLDTCHLFAAGYDVRRWDNFWHELSNMIDKNKVKVLHLNDSKFPLGSKKDRHSSIGQGEIGVEGFKEILLHPSIQNMPIILETPNDLAGWGEEIKMIRNWWKEAGIID